MTKTRLTAIRMTIEAIGVVLVAIFIVMNYEAQIEAVNWRMVSFICVGALAIFGMYRWQMRADNTYDVMDMLMKDGRADLYAHITVASFGLAVWLVVQQALAKQPITELMLGVLGIFVAGKAAGGFSDAMKQRGPPIDQSRDVNILAGAKVQPAAEQTAPQPATEEKAQYHAS